MFTIRKPLMRRVKPIVTEKQEVEYRKMVMIAPSSFFSLSGLTRKEKVAGFISRVALVKKKLLSQSFTIGNETVFDEKI